MGVAVWIGVAVQVDEVLQVGVAVWIGVAVQVDEVL